MIARALLVALCAAGCSGAKLAGADLAVAGLDGGALDGGGGDGGALFACGRHLPDPSLTPGDLCTATDPNFSMFRYLEKIPVCNRNVPTAERDAIGAAYGIAPADFANYEFDHFIPLSIGGSDSQLNIWPQAHVEALDKDRLEQTVFDGMNNGTLTQAQAIAMIRAWRPAGVTCP